MSPKSAQGLINAAIAYLLVSGLGASIMVLVIKAVVKEPANRLPWYGGLGIAFIAGLAGWLWVVRDLQRAFN